jgi:hypothetical protein
MLIYYTKSEKYFQVFSILFFYDKTSFPRGLPRGALKEGLETFGFQAKIKA